MRTKAQIVSFHCVLKNKVGKVLGSTFNHEVITECEGAGDILKGLAEGLKDLHKGDKRRISLTADQAYGFYDPDLVVKLPRKSLPQGNELEVGNEVLTESEDGERKVFRVVESALESVVLDGNHPLAGQDLVFEIEATAAREATSEEIDDSKITIAPPRQFH
jgi:FKBP-type peptidyl-prolyl cis-trans isomerase SlyD